MRRISKIILHCSATRKGAEFSVEDIRHWHLENGWNDVGYHWVIKLDGTIQFGRPVEQAGAHTAGHNATSIGICYIGGLDRKGSPEDTRTPAQKKALTDLIATLRERFGHIPVHGHREFANKACPCFDAFKEYN